MLNRKLDELCETSDPTDGMALVIGIPGVGKTQLCRKFAEDTTLRSKSRKGVDVRHLAIGTKRLDNQVNLFMAVAKALGQERKGRAIAKINAKMAGANIGVGAGPAKLSAGATFDHVRQATELEEMLVASKDEGMWRAWHGLRRKALVLVVDEIQTVDAEGMATLRTLHEGQHGCPILTLCAGLQHATDVFASRSQVDAISRVEDTIRLGSLSDDDAVQAIAGGLRAMGYEAPEPCVLRLAQASHGFPQHIHGYLAGAVDAIAKYGDLDEGPPLAMALSAGDQARRNYYDARLNTIPHKTPALLPVIAKMLESGDNAIQESEAVDAINAANYDGQTIVDQAVAHGVLTVISTGVVSFGIPSFHTHMVGELERNAKRKTRSPSSPRPAGG